MRDEDYLISTYRSHGHALSRGCDPRNVMAELFGREDGVSRGRGGSGMDVVDPHRVLGEAIRCARDERQPVLVEAVTYRFRGHSMADPEDYRSKEKVEEWRKRDPITTFAQRPMDEGAIEQHESDEIDRRVIERVDDAVAFDAFPFPPPESLYDDVYVLGDQVKGWYSVDARSAGIHRGEHERDLDEAERGPRGAYAAAVAQASEEDLGLERASDEAQSEDDLAEHP